MPYLIDGHNLIGQMPNLSLEDPDDEQKLIALLRAYLLKIGKKGAVIFDNGLPGGASKWSNATLEVRFAPQPKKADAVIIERLRRERNPKELIVVSGDNEVLAAARAVGAAVMRSVEFAAKMTARPRIPRKKEVGLSPEEVAAWEEEFRKRG
jgi:uncharacterized protein